MSGVSAGPDGNLYVTLQASSSVVANVTATDCIDRPGIGPGVGQTSCDGGKTWVDYRAYRWDGTEVEPGNVLIHGNEISDGVTERLRLADGMVISTAVGATDAPPWWVWFASASPILTVAAFFGLLCLRAWYLIREDRKYEGRMCARCGHRHEALRCHSKDVELIDARGGSGGCECRDFVPAGAERLASHPQADHCEDCGRRKPVGASCVACRLPVVAGVGAR